MSFADTARHTTDPVAEVEDFARSVHALFDDRGVAEKARQDLIAAGISPDAIALHGTATAGIDVSEGPEPGFWERVLSLFVPDDDRHTFAEGLRRGGVAIEVKTDTSNHDRVIDILDRDGAVDLDEREQSWRNEGWRGYTDRDPLAEGAVGATVTPAGIEPEEAPRYAGPSDATAGFAASVADHFPVAGGQAPPVESPGAVPADMLESASDPAPAKTWTRETAAGRPRVRSYSAAPPVRSEDPGLDL